MYISELRIELARNNMTIGKLHELSGLSHPTITKIVNNNNVKSVKLETIEKICVALNCNFEDIIKINNIHKTDKKDSAIGHTN